MNLFQSYTSLVKSSGAGDKVFSLLDRSPEAPGTGSTAVASSEIEIEEDVQAHGSQRGPAANSAADPSVLISDGSSSSCSVEIKDVCFTYPCRPDNEVLKNFNLTIPQGKTVALVGSSGESLSSLFLFCW